MYLCEDSEHEAAQHIVRAASIVQLHRHQMTLFFDAQSQVLELQALSVAPRELNLNCNDNLEHYKREM